MFKWFKQEKETKAEQAARIYMEGFMKVLAPLLVKRCKELNKPVKNLISAYELVLNTVGAEKFREKHKGLLTEMCKGKEFEKVNELYMALANEVVEEFFNKFEAHLKETDK